MNEFRYSDADDPFAEYCPACGGTGVDQEANTNGLPPYDGWDDEYPPCTVCQGSGLLYNDDPNRCPACGGYMTRFEDWSICQDLGCGYSEFFGDDIENEEMSE